MSENRTPRQKPDDRYGKLIIGLSDNGGIKMFRWSEKHGIPCKLLSDFDIAGIENWSPCGGVDEIRAQEVVRELITGSLVLIDWDLQSFPTVAEARALLEGE